MEQFRPLRSDIDLLALGSYIAELLEAVSNENVAEPEILQLGLNALYALANKLCPPKQVKAAFELRLMCLSGYRPELEQCAGREGLRVAGDLISANMYQMEKGLEAVDLPNFYEEGSPLLHIQLDPALTPSQNAQKYYKEYRKAKTAEEKLTEQIDLAGKELEYLESVLDALARAETERDLSEIRAELQEQGYLRKLRSKKDKPAGVSAPMEFTTSDGFTVLVGRNNRQNDKLTLKTANNNDIWFHTKNIPGSHTVLVTQGRQPTETAMEQAAQLAALHSRAKDSSQVPVDYTQIRHVSKPAGAKPGMVVYVQYKTVFVTPGEPPASGQ